VIGLSIREWMAISSALAFLVALVVAAVAATWTGRRLEHIVDIAGRYRGRRSAGPRRRCSQDDNRPCMRAIDATARHLERTFRRGSLEPNLAFETLLQQHAGCRHRRQRRWLVQWANQPMDRPRAAAHALQAPVSGNHSDPDFLAAVKSATEAREVKTARAPPSFPVALDVTAALCLMGGAVAWLREPHRNRSAWKKPVATLSPTFLMNCALPHFIRVIPKLFSTLLEMARHQGIYRSFARMLHALSRLHGGLAYVGESESGRLVRLNRFAERTTA